MRRRVVIVGAGPGGLAAAMLLARTDAEVTVVERQDRLGGRSGTIAAEGFRFDIGPTFFLYPRVLADIFAACGRRLENEVELIRLDPNYRLAFSGGATIDATCDETRMRAEIARLSPADGAALPAFLADNRKKLNRFRPVLEKGFDGPLDLFAPDVLRSLPALRPLRSVDSDLGRYFRDERVRLAFSFQSKYLGMSPFRCPSLFTILSFLEYEYGVWHPRGGTGAVMAAMARTAEAMGVTLRLGEPVERILFEGRRARGVRTAAGDIAADAVVINADFARAMTSLVPDHLRRRWTDRRIETKQFSCSTFMMYLGVEGRYDAAHHTIFLAEDYARNIAEIEDGRELPKDPSIYVQNACVTDPELAPPGQSTLYVLVPVGHLKGHVDWPSQRASYRDLVLGRLEALGFRDIRRRIRYEKIVTPLDWDQDLNIHRGATFNLSHTLGQMLHRRPHNRFEDLDGVYLVGGGTHPGSGLPVIFEGARITARALVADLGLEPDWQPGTAMAAGTPAIAEAI